MVARRRASQRNRRRGKATLLLRPRDRIVQLKVVYYGPAVCGKTTNLQMLHAAALGRHRGELITVNSQQERTILFDLLPLRGIGFHGFDVRFQVVAVPGQAHLRPHAAPGDARDRRRGVRRQLGRRPPRGERREPRGDEREPQGELDRRRRRSRSCSSTTSATCRDVLSVEQLSLALNARHEPELEAVALRGVGVLETLGTLLARIMADLTVKYRSLALGPDETVQTWAWGAIQQVFGRSTLADAGVQPTEGPAAADLRRVVVPAPKIQRGASAAEVDKALVGSYVETSMSLSDALDVMREERDDAKRRLRELELTVQAIESLGDGKSPADTLKAALGYLIEAAGCSRGTLIAPGPDQKLKVIAAVGMKQDPFVESPDGFKIVKQRFVQLKRPHLVDPEQVPEVAAAARHGATQAGRPCCGPDPQRVRASRTRQLLLQRQGFTAWPDASRSPDVDGAGVRSLVRRPTRTDPRRERTAHAERRPGDREGRAPRR